MMTKKPHEFPREELEKFLPTTVVDKLFEMANIYDSFPPLPEEITVEYEDKWMEWAEKESSDESRPISFRQYCTCGGYAWSTNNRNKESPHMPWCAQYEEWHQWAARGWKPWLSTEEWKKEPSDER
jgi:hypothetical protein